MNLSRLVWLLTEAQSAEHRDHGCGIAAELGQGPARPPLTLTWTAGLRYVNYPALFVRAEAPLSTEQWTVDSEQ